MEENERRELILAAAPILQPDYKSSSVTPEQLDRLKELHKRRLLIKGKMKVPKKITGNSGESSKTCSKQLIEDYQSKNVDGICEDSSLATLKEKPLKFGADGVKSQPVPKKRQKLFWGLILEKDGKEKPTCESIIVDID